MKKFVILLLLILPVIAILVLNITMSVVTDKISIPVEKIEFEDDAVVTNIGNAISLDVSVFPANASNKQLVWESSNPEIVQVDEIGNISFVGFGSAYVTVTSLDGSKKASCYFVVTDTTVHRVILFTIGQTREVKIGQSLQVYAQVIPAEALNKEVTFTSSNPNIASIDEQGMVIGLATGNTTILATSTDGGHVASIDIEVYESIKSISLPTYILTEQNFYQLDCGVIPSTADITRITFSSSNNQIANVDEHGKVVFSQAGSVLVRAQYEDLIQNVTIEFTNGYASALSVESLTKTIDYSQGVWQVDYATIPNNLYQTEVVFESSNLHVASVNSTGLVELQGGGVCVIGVSVQKYDETILQKNITLFVTRVCESIEAQNMVTAIPNIDLEFTALPEDNTCKQFLFEVDSNIATIENGVINFLQPGEVNVMISADAEQLVSRTIKVKYTGGLPTNFDIVDNIELNLGESFMILPKFTPSNTQTKNVNYIISNQSSPDGTSSGVVNVTNQGYVTALKGGRAVVTVDVVTANGIITKTVQVNVVSPITKIEILTELDYWNDGYVTGTQTVLFETVILPLSATNQVLEFSSNDNNASQIIGNSVVFAYPATIILTATNVFSGVSGFVKLTYTNQIQQVSFDTLPTLLMVDQLAMVTSNSHIPSNLQSSIVLQITSQTTKADGAVASVNGNSITGQNGGTAQVAVYVGGTYQTSFNIVVKRLVSSIDVYPKNVMITSQNILLNRTIMPLDASVSDVVWQTDQPALAQVINDVLIFYGYGIVNITVIVQDESLTSLTFWIERVTAQTDNIPATNQSHQMFVGGYIQIDNNQNMVYSVEQTNEVILISDGLVHALSVGTAVVICSQYNEFGALLEVNKITIEVFNYVQEILLGSMFNFYNGEYVTAEEQNQLGYLLSPNENVLLGVEFSLMPTTLASIEDNSLVFYGVGTVWLVGVSEDKNCTRIWNIRYTGGNAIYANFNIENTVNIEKNETLTIDVQEYVPSNTSNTQLQVSLLSVDAGTLINLFENTIQGVMGGTAQILVRFSANITKTITVNIIEHIEQIIFPNKYLVIAENTHILNPTLLPISATEKNLVYQSSDESIATIQNGIVIFLRPGSVEITLSSYNNNLIKDNLFIVSTGGYPNEIILNVDNLTLTTGETHSIYITSFSPKNVEAFELEYQIISSNSTIPQTQVVSVSDGVINALSSGTAIIKVSVKNPYSMDIHALVEVLVVPQVTDLVVEFDEILDKVGEVYITGKNHVSFHVSMLPTNIETTKYNFLISDISVATIDGQTINFLKVGVVKITFVSINSPNVEKSIVINFTNNNALDVEIDKTDFEMVSGLNQITLPANSSYQFEILSMLPSNIDLLNIVITQVTSTPNNSSMSVGSVSGNTILLRHGGSVTYNLNINGYDLGNFKFIVTVIASSIEIDSTNIYISVPSYSIFGTVLPADTTDKSLIYQSSNSSTAQVNQNGVVEFLSTGTVQIVVTNQASSISKTITISYSRKVENISFNPSKTIMSVGSVLLMNTQIYPAGIEGVLIRYISSDQEIATVDSTGKVVSKNKAGIVTISGYIVGNENVFTFVNIEVIKYITNIALELDNVGDNLGIGGYRVFGNKFISSNSYSNTYQMKVLNILPTDATIELLWSSSDETVATVSQEGLVNFVGNGNVTICVSAKNQYNPNMPVFDSYTFKVVWGVNVYNLEQFYKAINDRLEIVMQSDVIMTAEFAKANQIQTLTLFNDIHGNGFMLCLPYLLSLYNKLLIEKSDIIIDNLVLKGEEITTETTLDDLSASKILLAARKKTGIVLTNNVFEGAYTLVRAFDSEMFISGCVFKNSGFTHIMLSHGIDSTMQTIVTVQNSVFKDALIGAIIFDVDKSSNDTYASKLILKGLINIYNFREKSQMKADTLIAQHVPPVLQNLLSTNLSDLFDFLEGVKHTYNGKEYYHLGILKFNVDYYLGQYQCFGTVDMTQMNTPNPYREYEDSDIKAGVTLTINLWAVMPGNITTINPYSDFDSTIYKVIRYLK